MFLNPPPKKKEMVLRDTDGISILDYSPDIPISPKKKWIFFFFFKG